MVVFGEYVLKVGVYTLKPFTFTAILHRLRRLVDVARVYLTKRYIYAIVLRYFKSPTRVCEIAIQGPHQRGYVSLLMESLV